MMMKKNRSYFNQLLCFRLLLVIAVFMMGFRTAAAQDAEPAPDIDVEIVEDGVDPEALAESDTVVSEETVAQQAQDEKLESLESILLTLENVEAEILTAQRELRSKAAEGRENELKATIESLSEQKETLRQNFTIIASETELVSLSAKGASGGIEWSEELEELLAPLMSEVKRLTSRPREIERLRTAVTTYQERIHEIREARSKVQELRKAADSAAVQKALENLEAEWEERETSARTELRIRNQKLQQLLGEKKTIGESVKEIFDLFFRSRGRNLVLALLATIVFFVAIRRLFAWVQYVSPFHKGKLSYRVRLFNVLFLAFSGAGALVVFMVVLFFFGDWVLLTLALMFVIGVAWSSKQAIPRFWAQALLLLNMGPVREGERIEYAGVPWKVTRLNYYSTLNNPRLSSSEIRLPIQDLTDLRSRPSCKDEPWFPTEVDDWVLLADGTFGKVLSQTPEFVRMVLLGGSRKNYNTSDFIGQNPEVLSTGYRHSITFGIDYAHQALSTDEIPHTLQTFLIEKLAERDIDPELFSLKVEFESAGGSSLNLAVLADFDGSLGRRYQELGRLVNRLCVDACNEYGWVIPFEQLTLHVPSEVKVAGS